MKFNVINDQVEFTEVSGRITKTLTCEFEHEQINYTIDEKYSVVIIDIVEYDGTIELKLNKSSAIHVDADSEEPEKSFDIIIRDENITLSNNILELATTGKNCIYLELEIEVNPSNETAKCKVILTSN